jgi:DNA modification methylase
MTAPRIEQLADGVTLYLGDCREVLPTLPKVDAVVTDPPYGIGYASGHATDRLWAAGRKITNDGDVSVRDDVLAAFDCAILAFGSRKAPLPPRCRQVLIWDKQGALGMGALDLPWKPGHEEVYVLGKGFVGGRHWHSVITHPPTQAMACNGRTHPNEKPVGLIKMLIGWCPAGTVLDPFMGSGTTGVACVQLERKFIGIEIEPKYFDIACRRISDELKRPRLPFKEKHEPKQESWNEMWARPFERKATS